MNPTIAGASLSLAVLALATSPAGAETSAEATIPVKSEAVPLVPADFAVPTLIEGPSFKLVPLGPDVVKVDFDAYMSSIEHLQQTFTRSTAWPTAGITDADAMRDMENEQARFNARTSFAYAVLTPDGSRERGSVYVRPSEVDGYDAVVAMWVTKADYDSGFDAELYQWVTRWVAAEWPFARVAYPGRAIDWATWDAAAFAAKTP